MTDPIEPTEEQKQAARRICKSPYPHDVAHLLAEREHKLREHSEWLTTQCSNFEDANISNRETIKALNEENQRYCEQVAIEKRHYSILNKLHEQTTADLDAARARIAELESHLASTQLAYETVRDTSLAELERSKKRIAELESDVKAAAGELLVEIPEPGSVVARLLLANTAMRRQRDALAGDRVRDAAAMDARMQEREAAHLADIKALREAARFARDTSDRPQVRDELAEVLAATAHYDVEGGEG